MKQVTNQSYNRIMNFLKNNPQLNDEEKRYLIHYATELYKNNVENLENETLQDIFTSLKIYSNQLKECADTSITRNRITEIINILEQISKPNIDKKTLNEISYKLDKLYLETDLPLRENSSLSYNLENNKRKV